MPTATCLEREKLKAYLAGWADPELCDAIEAHLQECPDCEQTVAALEKDSDTLLEFVRRSSQAQPPVDNQSLEAVLQRVKQSSEALPEAPWQPPTTDIGAYELLRPIGSGGMGSVFIARHRQLGKQVAIKLLRLPHVRGEHYAARFQREIRAAGELEHPSIVNATDAGQHAGTHYLVMEYIDGLDLSRIARATGKLSIADACAMMQQVATGLSHAHAAGIVHRDVKPSNIMLNAKGQAKILDFGLAQHQLWDGASAELTTVGQLMGTLDYMAPEQADRPEAVDYRADLYSLGATLFRLLCGRAPLAASPNMSPLAKLRLLATHEAPRLSSLRSDAPDGLVQFVASLLSRNPDDRPPSAAHVAEQLAQFSAGADLRALLERARAVPTEEVESPASLPLTTASSPAASVSAALTPGLSPALKTSSTFSGNRHRFGWLMALAFSPLALFGGVLITLETQKGTLVIESESDVSVKLLRNGEIYDELKIQTGANSTRLYAGKYEVVIDDASDSVTFDTESVEVLRGKTCIAKVTRQPAGIAKRNSQSSASPLPASDTPADEPLYEGKKLSEWLDLARREKSSEGLKQAFAALGSLVSDSNRDTITKAMLEALPTCSTVVLRSGFSVLRKANPEDRYYALLAQQLQRGENAWQLRIFEYGLLGVSSGEEVIPLQQWLDANVLNRTAPDSSPLLTPAAKWYLDLLQNEYVSEARKVEILSSLQQSPALDQDFWLGYLPATVSTNGGEVYESWYPGWAVEVERRAIEALSVPALNLKQAVPAAIILNALYSTEFGHTAMVNRKEEVAQRALRIVRSMTSSEQLFAVSDIRLSVFRTASTASTLGGGGRPTNLGSQAFRPATTPFVLQLSNNFRFVNFHRDLDMPNLTSPVSEFLSLLNTLGYRGAKLPELREIYDKTEKLSNELPSIVAAEPRIQSITWPTLKTSPSFRAITAEQVIAMVLHQQAFAMATDIQPELRELSDAKEWLAQLDADKDGLVSLTEVEKVLPNSQLADVNHDGSISAREFIDQRKANQVMAESAQRASAESRSVMEWAVKQIQKYDGNQDGVLEAAEWEKMIIKPDGADADGDGKITVDEYTQWRYSKPKLQPPDQSNLQPARPTFNGRTLEQWLGLLKTEQSKKGIEDAIAGLKGLSNEQNRDQVKQAVLEAIETGRTEAVLAFKLLRESYGADAYGELLINRLNKCDNALTSRILSAVTPDFQSSASRALLPEHTLIAQWLADSNHTHEFEAGTLKCMERFLDGVLYREDAPEGIVDLCWQAAKNQPQLGAAYLIGLATRLPTGAQQPSGPSGVNSPSPKMHRLQELTDLAADQLTSDANDASLIALSAALLTVHSELISADKHASVIASIGKRLTELAKDKARLGALLDQPTVTYSTTTALFNFNFGRLELVRAAKARQSEAIGLLALAFHLGSPVELEQAVQDLLNGSQPARAEVQKLMADWQPNTGNNLQIKTIGWPFSESRLQQANHPDLLKASPETWRTAYCHLVAESVLASIQQRKELSTQLTDPKIVGFIGRAMRDFAELDPTGDGKIVQSELRGFGRQEPTTASKRVEREFSTIDRDRDQAVSLREYVEYLAAEPVSP